MIPLDIEAAVRTVEEFYGPFGDRDAVPQHELDSAGQRLGIVLPKALTVLYRRTGLNAPLHQSNDALLAPRDLKRSGDHLVFYKENQNVCQWGIPLASLGLDDPPVDCSYEGEHGELAWKQDCASVTEFLCAHGAWQAISGLPFAGLVLSTEIPGRGVVSKARPGLGRNVREAAARSGKKFVEVRGTTAWILDVPASSSSSKCVLVMDSDNYFGLACREGEQFLMACNQLGIIENDWSFLSPRDA